MVAIAFRLSIIVLGVALAGCHKLGMTSNSTWHQKFGWKAEDYFDDPKVIALCKAIEADDLVEIDRLVAAGANVNAKGKGNMTPLLWAYPDNKLERFTRMLEHGADPNITFQDDFGTRGAIDKGDSITHMATSTTFPGYFEAVFQFGGDPNLVKNGPVVTNETVLFTLIRGRASDKLAKARILIEKGAELDHKSGSGRPPVNVAVGFGANYELALLLLNAGADYHVYAEKENTQLIHHVVEQEGRLPQLPESKRVAHQKLLAWLDEHGESAANAREDHARWKSWSITTGEFQRKMAQEVAQRKAREAREKKAPDARSDEEKQPGD